MSDSTLTVLLGLLCFLVGFLAPSIARRIEGRR